MPQPSTHDGIGANVYAGGTRSASGRQRQGGQRRVRPRTGRRATTRWPGSRGTAILVLRHRRRRAGASTSTSSTTRTASRPDQQRGELAAGRVLAGRRTTRTGMTSRASSWTRATTGAGKWSPFGTPRFDDLILYQVHVGSFAGMNDGIDVHDPTGHETATFEQFAREARLHPAAGVQRAGAAAAGRVPRDGGAGVCADELVRAGDGLRPARGAAAAGGPGAPQGPGGHLRRGLQPRRDRGQPALELRRPGPRRRESTSRTAATRSSATARALEAGRAGTSSSTTPGCGWTSTAATACGSTWPTASRARACGTSSPACGPTRSGATSTSIAEWDGDDRGSWPGVVHELGFNAVWEMDGPYAFRAGRARG